MHIAWTRHLLDNREFIIGGGTQPNTEPSRGEGLDGSATAEERPLHELHERLPLEGLRVTIDHHEVGRCVQ